MAEISSSAYPTPQHCLLRGLLGLEVAFSSCSPAAPTAHSAGTLVLSLTQPRWDAAQVQSWY